MDDECIEHLVCICGRLFPTIGVSGEVQLIFLKMLSLITDDSLPGN